ncbi:DsbA family protein [Collimonas sp. NPDC087041]|uniref:DsbA family protein n=1 Tax=Collimonas sp. NPDC087041 TaxID=3363960 RepID=UPI003803D613
MVNQELECGDAACAVPAAAATSEADNGAAAAVAAGKVLHYIYDPMCGWCYGAAPLLQAARQIDGLDIVLHGGGMMTGSNRRQVSPALRNYVMQHDHRIAAMTGQVFGDNYFNGLLLDTTATFDSEPPITAILAADAIAGQGLELLERIQHAHYVDGRRVADLAVLRDLAAAVGLEPTQFDSTFAELSGAATQAHIARSRALLTQVGGQGFPTFALQRGERIEMLDTGRFLGQADAWKAVLSR